MGAFPYSWHVLKEQTVRLRFIDEELGRREERTVEKEDYDEIEEDEGDGDEIEQDASEEMMESDGDDEDDQKFEPITSVQLAPFFERTICIWRTAMHVVNRRIFCSEALPPNSEKFQRAFATAPQEVQRLGEQYTHEIRQLLPRTSSHSDQTFEAAFFISPLAVLFCTWVTDGGRNPHIPFPYLVAVEPLDAYHCTLRMSVTCEVPTTSWLQKHAFPTLVRWLATAHPSRVMRNQSLCLIDRVGYVVRYRDLKSRIGVPLARRWTECTDPSKHVFEDCGIAAYLLQIWHEQGRAPPQSFLDVGCGNGVLTYMLNQSEARGVGVDLRSRRLWASLMEQQPGMLLEHGVDPTQPMDRALANLRPDYLIANHSDELTPWVPVLAARLRCDFFLLPCCPFDFYAKFRDRRSDMSTYESFFRFVMTVCLRLGFDVQEDRLTIPSSKRRCIVGRIPSTGLRCIDVESVIADLTRRPNNLSSCEAKALDRKSDGRPLVSVIVAAKTGNQSDPGAFKIREAQPKNLNCTQLPRDFIDRLAMRIFDYLYTLTPEPTDPAAWHGGGEAAIGKIVELLSDEERRMLKEHNGGLRTFIRNHRHIFECGNSTVRIRDYRKPLPPTQNMLRAMMRRRRTDAPAPPPPPVRPCWMDVNHPRGCPAYKTGACVHRHRADDDGGQMETDRKEEKGEQMMQH